MSNTRMSHGTRMNESCHTHEWVMSLMWLSQVTHMNEWRHENDWAVSHIWIGHRTHVDESCPTHQWVTSHISMSRVCPEHDENIHLNESCRTYEWVMSHTWMSHITLMTESHHTHVWSSALYLGCGIRRPFSKKSHIIDGSFAQRDLQLRYT